MTRPPRRVRSAVAVLVTLAAVAPLASRATTVRALTLEELVGRAERIVRGRCLDVRDTTDARTGLPVTEVTFAVAETLKGPESVRLVFRQLGDRARPGPGPRFVVGEDALLFLGREGASGLTAPVGLEQGKIPIAPTGTVTVPASAAETGALRSACRRGERCDVHLGVFLDAVRGLLSR